MTSLASTCCRGARVTCGGGILELTASCFLGLHRPSMDQEISTLSQWQFNHEGRTRSGVEGLWASGVQGGRDDLQSTKGSSATPPRASASTADPRIRPSSGLGGRGQGAKSALTPVVTAAQGRASAPLSAKSQSATIRL